MAGQGSIMKYGQSGGVGSSPLFKAVGMVQTGTGIANSLGGGVGTPPAPPSDGGSAPGALPSPGADTNPSAIQRAIGGQPQDHMAQIDDGIKALNDPDNGLSYEDKMKYAPMLYGGKHGVDPSQQPESYRESQGQVQSGKSGDGKNALGTIATIAAMI